MIDSFYRIPDVPRLALLSDLHGRPYHQVIASLQKNKPDMICIAGDIIYGVWPEDDISPLVSQPYVLPFLERCADVAPAFLSLGNHEQVLDQDDLRKIRNTGITVLDNSWVCRDGFVIGGLTSAYVTDYRRMKPEASMRRYPRLQHIQAERRPETDWLKEFATVPGYHILLSHHPEYYPLIPDSVELMCHRRAILSKNSRGDVSVAPKKNDGESADEKGKENGYKRCREYVRLNFIGKIEPAISEPYSWDEQ